MHHVIELIERKKRGQRLQDGEIAWFVREFTEGAIPEYQASALLMAVWFTGFDAGETLALTAAMADSGQKLGLDEFGDLSADKHSTGGVGDKTTVVLVPMLMACGLTVAKMSGRGLGHTGGTLDKLESIPGMRTSFSPEEFMAALRKNGAVIAAQSEHMVPADKKLYALRDVTGTVDNPSLIASSITSKKLACGAKNVVFDVKCGSGSFVKGLEDARLLAGLMVSIMKGAGRRACALITGMDQPLGREIGNALEVREAVLTLQGGGEKDLLDVCARLGSELLVLSGLCASQAEGTKRMLGSVSDGSALEALRRLVESQGGDPRVADDPDGVLEASPVTVEAKCPENGYVAAIDCEALGRAANRAGAGRERLGDPVDHAAGVSVLKKPGDAAGRGETLALIHAASRAAADEAALAVAAAYSFSGTRTPPLVDVLEVVR